MLKLLTTPDEMAKALKSAMDQYQCYRWSVAWASIGFSLYEHLAIKQNCIAQLVVGTHFYQTHPDFLEAFVDDERVRVVLQPSGIFHPKIYLFENADDDWTCIIGSANFTGAAFSNNAEAGTRIDSTIADAVAQHKILRGLIDKHWAGGSRITKEMLSSYRSIWKRKAPLLAALAGTYGGRSGKPIPTIKDLALDWPAFVARVKGEKYHGPHQRIQVLQYARACFKRRLCELGITERRRIAGLSGKEGGTDWGYFGSMKGAGWFWRAINTNSAGLSDALDAIPSEGLVSQANYEQFIERFKGTFPKGERLAVATRLLCMKRPDTFICLDSRNRKRLCAEFGIPQNVSYETYWPAIIERVREAVWWNAPRPSGNEEEEEIWLGRAAFMDAFYYEE